MALRDEIAHAANRSPAQKLSKASVGYSAGKPNAHCGPGGRFGPKGRCQHYRAGTCEIVAGIISPDMWCRRWSSI